MDASGDNFAGRKWRFGKSETAFGGWPFWEVGSSFFHIVSFLSNGQLSLALLFQKKIVVVFFVLTF